MRRVISLNDHLKTKPLPSLCQRPTGHVVSLCLSYTVVAGRAKPQQPGEQSGGAALSGKQEGVREEGDGHRGAELGGRLRRPAALLLPLVALSLIVPRLQPLIFTSSTKQQLCQNSSATRKQRKMFLFFLKEDIQRTTQAEWTLNLLANTSEGNERGNQLRNCVSRP